MDVKQIEELLLQDMDNIRGGTSTAGVCTCPGGAGQSTTGDGTCICSEGGAGQTATPSIIKCFCGSSGGAAQKSL